MGQTFRLFPRQLYDGILLFAVAYASYQILIACWLNSTCVRPGDVADYALWGGIVLAAFLLLIHARMTSEFARSWKTNWAVALFIFYSILSIAWSVKPEQSIHTVYIMIASSITASVFAIIRAPVILFRYLFGFTAIVGVVSLLTILLTPEIGIHVDNNWRGAWKGIFLHKNDLGALMTLGNALSLLAYIGSKNGKDKTVSVLVYVLTLFLIVMSRSTTAYVVWFLLNSLTAVYFLWIKWGDRLPRRWIAYGSGILAGIGVFSVIAIVNLSGKSFNLTGRVPLWITLFENVISKKPWFGYGLETLWRDRDFQKWAGATSGWGDTIVVINGHNGYIDIWLYLGAVGLILLLYVLATGVIGTFARARSGRTWLNFFPLLTMVYFLVTNLAMDYMLEFESFHWFVILCICFLPSGVFTDLS